ncbi:uncharacterized protein LTR77_003354 [Saxophila tyrrhenica]|uniref:Rhodopsin domain-containing protein n=1 Tax=Saxophila tyrrhenica TaxID=1690608 RepID=A0AAV9PFZ7_9PEZI|nr:hypothetical protein LTR77_003354 [Saxophila tyrrhenica]
MRYPPISVILQWPTPNYDSPETRGPALLIVNIIFMILVVAAVAGRFYARTYYKKWFGIDDVMCVFALIFTLATAVVVILANEKFGWNRHIYDIPFDWIERANIIAFIAKLTFTFAATFIRLSLICFYYRLVKDSGIRWFNWVLHASVLWTLAVGITFICLGIWLCSPVESYWIFPQMDGATCIDEGKTMLGAGVVNTVSDLWVTIVPIPLIMQLRMPLKQRMGVCVLLCLGMIVTIAGALRTYFTWKSLMDSWDETWHAYSLWICAAVELDIGLICSCAPAWKSLLARHIAELTSKLSSLRTPNASSNDPSATTPPPSRFNPLRSIPWFQHTRFDFERTKRSRLDASDEIALQQVEKSGRVSEMPLDDDGHEERRYGARTKTPPPLQISLRQSLDQRSVRLSHEEGNGSRERR